MKVSVWMAGAAAVALGFNVMAPSAFGDEGVQSVDTKGLPKLGDKWLDKDPFVGNKTAIEVGTDAYGQNCARCHGLQMISGGIAPDLRKVPVGQEGDDLFKLRMQQGAKKDGMTEMPIFNGLLPQETLWAIRAYMVSLNIPE